GRGESIGQRGRALRRPPAPSPLTIWEGADEVAPDLAPLHSRSAPTPPRSTLYALRTWTSSLAAFSPVSLRKMCSSPVAPASACRRRSSIVPHARIFPP